MRFALKVSYDGTLFEGWQIQPNGRTVQGELEKAASNVFGVPVKITGSGRTDAGVHAEGQVCMFDAQTTIPAAKLRECFNRLLPADVRVLKSVCAPQSFDCTRGAKRKTYRYIAYYAESDLPLLSRYAARIGQKPNLQKMRAEAELIVGEHDFKAFCASGSSAKTSVRTVYSAEVSEKKENGYLLYTVTVCGNGFLYNMVRIIAGHLFAVGCGVKEEKSVLAAFETGKRSLLGKTKPPQGLTLAGVEYGDPLFSADGR